MSRPLLTPRRQLKTTDTFEPAVSEFLKMPISFDKFEANPKDQNEIPKKKHLSIRERSISTAREYQSDRYLDKRRRTFDVAFERKSKLAHECLEKEWSEAQRLRDWKNTMAKRDLKKKTKKVDNHVIERIVQERNEYYLSASADPGVPPKPNVPNIRSIPKEVRATTMYSARPQTARSFTSFH